MERERERERTTTNIPNHKRGKGFFVLFNQISALYARM